MRKVARTGLLLALLAFGAGPTLHAQEAPAPPWSGGYGDLEPAIQALSASDRPRAWAVAATLRAGADAPLRFIARIGAKPAEQDDLARRDAQTDALIDRAIARGDAEHDATLQALLAAALSARHSMTRESDGPERDPRRRRVALRWQALEPDNAAAWIAGEHDAAVARIASLSHYDRHALPMLRVFHDELRGTSLRDGEGTAYAAWGMAMLTGVDALVALGRDCMSPDDPKHAGREACDGRGRQVGALLALHADNPVDQELGAMLWSDTAVDDDERARADQALRDARRRQERTALKLDDRPAVAALFKLADDPGVRTWNELAERYVLPAGAPAP